MLVKKYLFIFQFILLGCFLQQEVHAQCISSFPYDENFEASDGNWTRSSADHWEWGTVTSKPVITGAGGGNKCWIAGGLSGSSYNSGKSSLTSPCFDISSLAFPEISFKVFWETERKYDGANIQYSLDGGVVWLNLGSINSNSTCQGSNWFNYDPVNFLGSAGWSGNVQATSGSCLGTGGSGSWLPARHSLQNVTGATGIIFRFVFAAGLTCNAYDGFAIDDMHIGETAANSASFTSSCGANNTASFTSSAVGCKTSVSWDFGDPASGTANNTSILDNPTHIFSSPGTYNVVLTTNFATGPSLSIPGTVKVISATPVIVSNIKCNGDANGAITVNVNPSGTYNYSWDTNPVQSTASINNLTAGIYTVTISGTNTCSVTLPVQLTDPAKLLVTQTKTDATCGASNGSIVTTTSGGTGAYTYLWSNAAVTADLQNLVPGSYSVTVTDANTCTSVINNIAIVNKDSNLSPDLGNDRNLCQNQTILLNPGNFASYKWQDNSVSPTFTVTMPGIYSVTVRDNAGCTGSATVNIKNAFCTDIYFPSAFTPNGDTQNESFGPLPVDALSSLKNYRLSVYGRWGELIFTTTDPFKKWDGNYKGKPLPIQVVTWMASYTPDGLSPVFQKGTLNIIR